MLQDNINKADLHLFNTKYINIRSFIDVLPSKKEKRFNIYFYLQTL